MLMQRTLQKIHSRLNSEKGSWGDAKEVFGVEMKRVTEHTMEISLGLVYVRKVGDRRACRHKCL